MRRKGGQPGHRHSCRSRLVRKAKQYRARLEPLENRQLLSTVDWISTTSGNWDVASNWSDDAVPGPGDDVVINVSGATPTVTISTGNQSVHSITASDPLSITGGSLTVAADSAIGGGLAMTGGSLVANGSGISLAVTGTTTVFGASLYAEGGAALSLSQLTSYTEPNTFSSSTLEATGSGSLLSLPALTSIAVTAGDTTTFVEAPAGGDVELPLVTQITGSVDLETNSASSTLDLTDLFRWYSHLQRRDTAVARSDRCGQHQALDQRRSIAGATDGHQRRWGQSRGQWRLVADAVGTYELHGAEWVLFQHTRSHGFREPALLACADLDRRDGGRYDNFR
jgi:hypothetical protein